MVNREPAVIHIRALVSLVAISLFLVLLDGNARGSIKEFTITRSEDGLFKLDPSASRASRYGLRHFDAQDPALYDIDRAEYFYGKALEYDAAYPYVHHQLARVAFLRGNFEGAMIHINTEIDLHGEEEPNTYYIRALIEGYMGDYDASARDYEHFLASEPNNWATMNDYAWVLLKAGKAKEAAVVTERGIGLFPDNPWLLNSHATALYELGRSEEALPIAQKAVAEVNKLREEQWLHAYPGNDPRIAGQGISSFREAVINNMHMIKLAVSSGEVQ